MSSALEWTLDRTGYRSDGIFGILRDENGQTLAVTLEHAYANDSGGFEPKVAAGNYTCDRHAPNRLPYETFELQGVPDFQGKPVTGILIHILNFNSESDGCIGVGRSLAASPSGMMIANSKEAFEEIMNRLDGVQSFQLSIVA